MSDKYIYHFSYERPLAAGQSSMNDGISERSKPIASFDDYEAFREKLKSDFDLNSQFVITSLTLIYSPVSPSGSKADARDEIVEILFKYIDRMNDLCDEDPADQILEEFTEAVDPAIQRYLDAPD
ncbi:MAG: hypothetical protein AB2799_19150 [Candidatus Thiodiazotropha sp.]